MSMTKCQKCGQDINKLSESGKYLRRISPLGEDFVGVCAPACEYHSIRPNNNTSLINVLNDATSERQV